MMENPIITTSDERLVGGNMNSQQIKEMRSHNLYTTLLRDQKTWEFCGTGKTDTYAVPWHFKINEHPELNFIATQYKNMFGSETVTIFLCDEKFTYDLDVMPEIKTYPGHIDLFNTVNKFVLEFDSILETLEEE